MPSDDYRFFELFHGRVSKVGRSEPVGNGRDVKGKEKSEDCTEPLLRELIQAHLYLETWGVGCYPVNIEGKARWGCMDFDSKTSEPAQDAAYALSCIKRAGLDGVVEISRSGDGRHVWVFLDDWVDADDLRKCLLLIDTAAAIECSEINPKQRVGTDFTKNVGNYVRLPYHRHWMEWNAQHNERRMICVDEFGNDLDLEAFLDYAESHRASSARVLELAERYHPVPPPKREVPMKGTERRKGPVTQDAHLIMRGEAVMHEGGFHDGRNNKLWNFAKYISGHPAYASDIGSAYALMEHVWNEQLVQEPDFIPLDVCREMIRRAFEEANNAEDIR